jgi:hypothetical protein
VEPGCPTYNGDGAGTADTYCPGGDPLCPSWGSDAPQGHFGGSGWIPAICEQRSLKAKYPICFGVDHDGSLGKVAAVKFAPRGSVLVWWDVSSTRAIRKFNLARYLGDGGVFEQLIISLDVHGAPNGIGSARAAHVLLLQPP